MVGGYDKPLRELSPERNLEFVFTPCAIGLPHKLQVFRYQVISEIPTKGPHPAGARTPLLGTELIEQDAERSGEVGRVLFTRAQRALKGLSDRGGKEGEGLGRRAENCVALSGGLEG